MLLFLMDIMFIYGNLEELKMRGKEEEMMIKILLFKDKKFLLIY